MLLCLLVGTAALFTGASADCPTGLPSTFQARDIRRVHELWTQGKFDVILDVRTNAEYEGLGSGNAGLGHVAGSINVPGLAVNAALSKSELLNPHRDDAIGIFCTSGYFASLAAANLRRAGYSCVFNLGGTQAWAQAGYPIEFGPYIAPSTENDSEEEQTVKAKPKSKRKKKKLTPKVLKSRGKKKKNKKNGKKKTKTSDPTVYPGSRAEAEEDAKNLSKGGTSFQELLGLQEAIGMDVDGALVLLQELNPTFDFRTNHIFSQYPFVSSNTFARLLHDNSNVVKSVVRK